MIRTGLILTFLAAVAGSQGTIPMSGSVTWAGIGPASNLPMVLKGVRCNCAPCFQLTALVLATTDRSGTYSNSRSWSLCYRTTHLTGDYPISRLYPGGITFAFCQQSCTLTIPKLIVFVHGTYGGPSHWSYAARTLSLQGFPLAGLNVTGMMSTTPFFIGEFQRTHLQNAAMLDAEVRAIKREIFMRLGRPEQPISFNLVAHNSGGLVARAYIANHTGGPGQDTVDKCVTLGTPHAGIAWLSALPPNHPLLVNSVSVREMRIGFMLTRFPAQTARGYGSTRFYLVGSSVDVNPAEPELIPGWPGSPNDDGLVSTFSALYPFAGATIAGTATFPEFNNLLPVHRDVVDQIARWFRQP